MKTARLLARFLRKTWIVTVARLFGFSSFGIRLAAAPLLPSYLLQNIRLWPLAVRYSQLSAGKRNPVRAVLRYFIVQANQVVWTTLVYEAWNSVLKHQDFRGVQEIRAMAARGRGLLLLGMHYGPRITSYVLHREGLNPVALALRKNIPDVDQVAAKTLLPKEDVFRGTYDGFVEANGSEKSFVRLMRTGRPGLILNDMFVNRNVLAVRCLGADYPIAVFPFKLALKYAFPVAVVWFSRIAGRGFRLNVREISFSTVEDGITQYAALLEQMVATDPFPWQFGLTFTKIFHPPRSRQGASV